MASAVDHLPELGVGLVLLPGLDHLIDPGSKLVDLIEIEPQSLWLQHQGSYRLHKHAFERIQSFDCQDHPQYWLSNWSQHQSAGQADAANA
jgi:hypothetical protein